jgi:hypothetical protein
MQKSMDSCRFVAPAEISEKYCLLTAFTSRLYLGLTLIALSAINPVAADKGLVFEAAVSAASGGMFSSISGMPGVMVSIPAGALAQDATLSD